jgi:GNAT superfamily N-acetyltransferase
MTNGRLTVQPVSTSEEKKEFVHFQWEVYRDDPNWVPPLLSERFECLDRERHPFHHHSDVEFFVARRDGRPVGTIAAILNKRHNEFHEEQTGFFGFFEVLRDREAAEALLQTAADWVRERGMSAIRGPASFSTNEEVGLLVDGWNGPPLILMTYNPPYYVDFVEGAGFTKAMDLLAYDLDMTQYGGDVGRMPAKMVRVATKIQQRSGITVRKINMRRFDDEVERFKRIYNSAWERNWGFVPLTDEEIDHTAAGLKMVIDPDVTVFAEKDGEVIGAMLPLPDVSQALIRAHPRPGVPEWWTMLRLLWHWKVRRRVTRFRAFAGGVLEQYRGLGVDAVLIVELCKVAVDRYRRCEMSWILENNTMMRRLAEMFGAEIYRTYRLYEKQL